MSEQDDARAEAEALTEFMESWYDRWAGPGEEWTLADMADGIIEWKRSRPVSEPSAEAIEAAARALHECWAQEEIRLLAGVNVLAWNDIPRKHRERYRAEARTALKAAAEVNNG